MMYSVWDEVSTEASPDFVEHDTGMTAERSKISAINQGGQMSLHKTLKLPVGLLLL